METIELLNEAEIKKNKKGTCFLFYKATNVFYRTVAPFPMGHFGKRFLVFQLIFYLLRVIEKFESKICHSEISEQKIFFLWQFCWWKMIDKNEQK